MRTAALAILAAAALAPAAASSPLEVAFQPPAQAGPAVAAAGLEWALLVFGESGSGAFELALPAGAAEANFTLHRVRHEGPEGVEDDVWMPEQRGRSLPPLAAQVAVRGTGSLYLAGDELSVQADGVRSEAVRGRCAQMLLTAPERGRHEARYGSLCPGPGEAAVVARGLDGGAAVRVVAKGLRAIEWHNVDVACAGAEGGCPGGGGRSVAGGAPAASVESFGYRRLATADAAIEGAAVATRVLMGGGRFDLAVAGQVRLPLAEGALPCCGELDGRTLRVEGDILLSGLHAAPDGTLRASLGGSLAAARLDEAGIDPAVLLGVAGAAAATGLLALLAKAALAAFTRLTPERALEARPRQGLMEAIRAQPGIHERALARLAGQSPSTVRHHVKVLAAQGLVRRQRHGRTVRLFDLRPGAARWAGPPLLEEPLRRLDGWRKAHPGASRADAVRHATAAWGWSRSTTYHRLARLEALQRPAAGAPSAPPLLGA